MININSLIKKINSFEYQSEINNFLEDDLSLKPLVNEVLKTNNCLPVSSFIHPKSSKNYYPITNVIKPIIKSFVSISSIEKDLKNCVDFKNLDKNNELDNKWYHNLISKMVVASNMGIIL